MKKLLAVVAFVCLAIAARAQNLSTVSASNITDINGTKLAAGQLCFLITDQQDNPISVSIGGGGQALKRGYCSPVAAGVVTGFTVPNPAATLPTGIYYRVTVKDSSTGQEVLRYTQVSFTGATFNFDNYAPLNLGSAAPLSGNSVTGNLSVTGNVAATGTVNGSNIPAGQIDTGTGTTNTLPKYTTGASGILGNSSITDDGTTVNTAEKVTLPAAKNIGGVQYAAQFLGSSTTCGIAEAYAALPAGGGKIILQNGNCPAAGWPVTIQKPIVIEGQGMGGPSDPGTNATVIAGSSLTNTSTGSSFFTISLGAGTSVEGVTLKDFAMIGNKGVGGATAGNCVDINGGTAAQQVRAIAFENIQCNQPKGSGFVIQDNAFIISFNNVHVDQSGSHCYVIKAGPNSGATSQIHFIASVGDLCGGNNASSAPGTADGWNISGTGARTVDIIASTLADSNNGVNVVVGAINTNVHITNSDFETNTTCDVSLNDGFGHLIMGSTLFGTGVGARGVCTAMPAGAATQPNQLLMYGNNINSHTVQDVTIGANQKTGFILPQSANNYSYSDASGHVVKMDVNQFGILTIAAAEITPAVNGATASGDSAAAWSVVYGFSFQCSESTPTAGVGAKGVIFCDSGDHMLKYNPNNGGEQHVPQVYRLTAQYTNSTTGFTTIGTPNIAFPVNANQSYTADCHLYYQAAATGGLNIQFTGPASPTAVIYGLNDPVSNSAFGGDSVATAFSTSLGSVVTTAATNFDAAVSFSLINGANAGTVTLQAKSSAAVQLQIQAGSFCQVQ